MAVQGDGQVGRGDSDPRVTAVSVKNKEQSGSFKTSKSGGSVSHRGPCMSGFNTTPSKKHRFHKSCTEFCSLVSVFELNRSKPVSVERGVDSEYTSPAKWQRYGKTNQVQFSISGSGKSVFLLQCSFCDVLLELVLVQIKTLLLLDQKSVHKPNFSSGEHLPHLAYSVVKLQFIANI
jgi:hypothetical protein